LQTPTPNNGLGIKIRAKILPPNYFSDHMHPNQFVKDSQKWHHNSYCYWTLLQLCQQESLQAI